MHCVASRFGYPNYRWSQLVRIIDVLLYYFSTETMLTRKRLNDRLYVHCLFVLYEAEI